MSDNILEIRDLHVSFDMRHGERIYAVRGIDLEVKRGEVLALVGESGSGKSVTGKAVLGILPPSASITSGSIKYNGEELTELKCDGYNRIRGSEISMVPQDPFLSLDPIAPVGAQIAESIRKHDTGGRIGREERRRGALELMREVGIAAAEERYGDHPFRLSGGQRQRIAIAAALAPSPRLLICDEPTTALDVTIEAQILGLFERLKRQRALSMLFITHDLGVVARMADRVAVMYAGRIVEIGEVDEIFYEPRHPYTWSLLSSVPSGSGGRLRIIPGYVPDMRDPPIGDAFAPRSEWAMRIDHLAHPPFFDISPTHRVASWLYHKNAPRAEMPSELRELIAARLEERRRFLMENGSDKERCEEG